MSDPLAVMWGKSKASESMHLLIAHLLDTAAVGELLWDRYLSAAIRRQLDSCTNGRGRLLLSVLCGLHDVGKATPAFQAKDSGLAEAVRSAGFGWSPLMNPVGWHHTLAGARIVQSVLRDAGWSRDARGWFWPLIAGHHGRVPGSDKLEPKDHRAHGDKNWAIAQRACVDRVLGELDVELGELARIRRPARAVQLAVAGLVIMADWIASDDHHFPGVACLDQVSMSGARSRALASWKALGLRGGWDVAFLDDAAEIDLVQRRFDNPARASQRDVMAVAERMQAPGLLIVEAPMGEGKTEAALAAAEILARRFGADGVFVGMPTQATSDPMFNRVRSWLAKIDAEVPVALLHGRSRFNREWMNLRRSARLRGVGEDLDAYGLPDAYGGSEACCQPGDGQAAAEWFLGHKRGLLTPVVIGTVDQLLHAATRTKHVMLRHAGLAGRVVILDEVHAYDVYMSQFLFEALRWLANAGVPVVLLSATLPPAMRNKLAHAYAQGATGNRDLSDDLSSPDQGYPRVTAVNSIGDHAQLRAVAGTPWRESTLVRVELLAETPLFDPSTVSRVVTDEMAAGGRALVVCNTVDRAQSVYRLVREAFGADAVLLHARLTAATRAERTERLVTQLGARADRPHRLVIVATQLAEQSFDVDVDLLVSDLAPIDLLLQRVGRLHRHKRAPTARPARHREPRVIISGLCLDGWVPRFSRGSVAVYGEYPLLRAAALVKDALEAGWSVPAQVPELVAAGYSESPIGPAEWADRIARVQAEHHTSEAERAARASQFLLAGEQYLGSPSLAGLHDRHTADLDDEDTVAAVVRDGDPSIEVVLVRRDAHGYCTLAGRSLGPQGEAITNDTVLEEVAGSTVRLPARAELTTAARSELSPLPGWAQDPWLGRTRALVLNADLSVVLGKHRLTYDHDLGLIVKKTAG